MSKLNYWLWLTTRRGLSGQSLMEVLDHFGTPESAYFADREAYDRLPGLTEQARRSLEDKSLSGADQILGDCDRLGIRVITIQDAIYPERLRAIHQPPLVLYWKGRDIAVDQEAAVALVGTRSATPYGVRMAEQLGLDLTRAGALVVSGIAQGIDAASLRGALKAGGPVISVLGGGIDVIYPRHHRDLYADVAAAGALVSEYPPGTETRGGNFPVRNRIISGLSLGVAVVESPRTGGSLLTAGHALDQDREVFAVPGPADAPNSVGTNRLIQEGAAKLIFDAGDILCEFADRFPAKFGRSRPLDMAAREQRLEDHTPQPAPRRSAPAAPAAPEPAKPEELPCLLWSEYRDRLTDDQRDILLALEKGPALADDLVEHTQIPARRVLAALTILQVQGFVAEESGKRFRALARLKMEP